jgi:hypothetical protein
MMENEPFIQDKKYMLEQEKYLKSTKEFMFLILNKFEEIIL